MHAILEFWGAGIMELLATIVVVLSQVSLHWCRARHSVSLVHDASSELTLVSPRNVPTLAQLIPILEGLDPPESKISKLKKLIPIYDDPNQWTLNKNKRLVEILPFKKKVKPLAFILSDNNYVNKLKNPPEESYIDSDKRKESHSISDRKNINKLNVHKHSGHLNSPSHHTRPHKPRVSHNSHVLHKNSTHSSHSTHSPSPSHTSHNTNKIVEPYNQEKNSIELHPKRINVARHAKESSDSNEYDSASHEFDSRELDSDSGIDSDYVSDSSGSGKHSLPYTVSNDSVSSTKTQSKLADLGSSQEYDYDSEFMESFLKSDSHLRSGSIDPESKYYSRSGVSSSSLDSEPSESYSNLNSEPESESESAFNVKSNVESDDSESNVESTESESNVESDDSEANVESNESESNVQSDDYESNVESNESESNVESDDSESNVESVESESNVESDDSESNVESNESESNVESDDSESNVESNESESNVESDDSESNVESNESETNVQSDDSESNVKSNESESVSSTDSNESESNESKSVTSEVSRESKSLSNVESNESNESKSNVESNESESVSNAVSRESEPVSIAESNDIESNVESNESEPVSNAESESNVESESTIESHLNVNSKKNNSDKVSGLESTESASDSESNQSVSESGENVVIVANALWAKKHQENEDSGDSNDLHESDQDESVVATDNIAKEYHESNDNDDKTRSEVGVWSMINNHHEINDLVPDDVEELIVDTRHIDKKHQQNDNEDEVFGSKRIVENHYENVDDRRDRDASIVVLRLVAKNHQKNNDDAIELVNHHEGEGDVIDENEAVVSNSRSQSHHNHHKYNVNYDSIISGSAEDELSNKHEADGSDQLLVHTRRVANNLHKNNDDTESHDEESMVSYGHMAMNHDENVDSSQSNHENNDADKLTATRHVIHVIDDDELVKSGHVDDHHEKDSSESDVEYEYLVDTDIKNNDLDESMVTTHTVQDRHENPKDKLVVANRTAKKHDENYDSSATGADELLVETKPMVRKYHKHDKHDEVCNLLHSVNLPKRRKHVNVNRRKAYKLSFIFNK